MMNYSSFISFLLRQNIGTLIGGDTLAKEKGNENNRWKASPAPVGKTWSEDPLKT